MGDEAEEAVVNVIQKTGKKLLEEWAQRKSDQAAEEASNRPNHRPHEKKSKLANFVRRYRSPTEVFSFKREIQNS